MPYNAVLRLLRTYLTANAVFASPVGLFPKLDVPELLGFTRSAVNTPERLWSTGQRLYDQIPHLFLQIL